MPRDPAQGDYEYYLTKNDDEAAKMEEKAERAKEVEKDNIKAKSKVRSDAAMHNHGCCVRACVMVSGKRAAQLCGMCVHTCVAAPCTHVWWVHGLVRAHMCVQMSKAEKERMKKDKAKAFHAATDTKKAKKA